MLLTRIVGSRNGRKRLSRRTIKECSTLFYALIHFHGAPPVLEAAFEKSGIDGVLVIYNWGIGSGAYEDPFAAPGTFSQVIASITAGALWDSYGPAASFLAGIAFATISVIGLLAIRGPIGQAADE